MIHLLISLPLAALAQSAGNPLEQALTLFNAGKYQQSFSLVSIYAQSHPESGAARKILGMDQFMLGRPREALVELKRATELSPTDADAFYYLGRLHFSLDDAAGALAALERAIRLDPSSVRAHNHLGQTYEALGRLPEAEQAYLKTIALEQKQPKRSEWPYFNLGVLYLRDGRTPEAIAVLRQALSRRPEWPEAKVKLAVALSAAGQANEAVALLEQAVQSDPRNAEGHYRLALLFTKLGRAKEAEQQFSQFEKCRKP